MNLNTSGCIQSNVLLLPYVGADSLQYIFMAFLSGWHPKHIHR